MSTYELIATVLGVIGAIIALTKFALIIKDRFSKENNRPSPKN